MKTATPVWMVRPMPDGRFFLASPPPVHTINDVDFLETADIEQRIRGVVVGDGLKKPVTMNIHVEVTGKTKFYWVIASEVPQ